MSQNKLLDIAIREFGLKGLDGASTRGIAAAAGTAMSSITYHYGSKDALYLAAADHVARMMADELGPAIDLCQPIGSCTPDQARAGLHAIADRLAVKMASDSSADSSLFILREQMKPSAAFARIYDGGMGRVMQQVVDLIIVVTNRPPDEARIMAITLLGQVLTIRGFARRDPPIARDRASRFHACRCVACANPFQHRRHSRPHDGAGAAMSDTDMHADPGNADDAPQRDDAASDDRAAEQGEQRTQDDQDSSPKKSLFKKPIFWIILICVVAAAMIGGTLYYLDARQYESTDDAFVDAHIVRISAQNAGQLIQVADLDNRHVDAGRLLAVIQPSGPEAQLSEAKANVAQAEAQVQQALAQVSAAVAGRAQAAAQARVPLANAEKAQQDLARYRALERLDANAVAGQQIDQARAAAKSSAADALAARRQVDSAESQIAVAQRQVKAAEAVVKARSAAVDQANVTLGDLRLTAPVSGQVVNRQVNVGSYVSPGAQLMAIVPDRMWITANFKETQLALMRIGQPVEIDVDAYPGVKFRGHVDSIQRGAGQAFALLPPQNATGNYVKVVQRVPVRIVFDRGAGAADPLRYPIGPGMSVVPTVKVR